MITNKKFRSFLFVFSLLPLSSLAFASTDMDCGYEPELTESGDTIFVYKCVVNGGSSSGGDNGGTGTGTGGTGTGTGTTPGGGGNSGNGGDQGEGGSNGDGGDNTGPDPKTICENEANRSFEKCINSNNHLSETIFNSCKSTGGILGMALKQIEAEGLLDVLLGCNQEKIDQTYRGNNICIDNKYDALNTCPA